jgi:hypothetical protein
MRLSLILASGLILLLARTSWADGGTIRFQGDAGSLHVTVFTLPPLLNAGPVDVTVLLQDRSRLNPLLDARVTLNLSAEAGSQQRKEAWSPPACALNAPSALADIPASLNHGENRLLYGAVIQVPYSGIWKLNIHIQHDSETVSVSTLLKVNPPAPPPLAYWQLFILPPLGVIGFILNRTARHTRRRSSGVQEFRSSESESDAGGVRKSLRKT